MCFFVCVIVYVMWLPGVEGPVAKCHSVLSFTKFHTNVVTIFRKSYMNLAFISQPCFVNNCGYWVRVGVGIYLMLLFIMW